MSGAASADWESWTEGPEAAQEFTAQRSTWLKKENVAPPTDSPTPPPEPVAAKVVSKIVKRDTSAPLPVPTNIKPAETTRSRAAKLQLSPTLAAKVESIAVSSDKASKEEEYEAMRALIFGSSHDDEPCAASASSPSLPHLDLKHDRPSASPLNNSQRGGRKKQHRQNSNQRPANRNHNNNNNNSNKQHAKSPSPTHANNLRAKHTSREQASSQYDPDFDRGLARRQFVRRTPNEMQFGKQHHPHAHPMHHHQPYPPQQQVPPHWQQPPRNFHAPPPQPPVYGGPPQGALYTPGPGRNQPQFMPPPQQRSAPQQPWQNFQPRFGPGPGAPRGGSGYR